MTNLRVKISRGTQLWGEGMKCEIYLQELDQIHTVNI